ncbi:MAG: glycosyltransferase family 2 protein [Ignavibacteriaceae bacterium]
MKISIITPTYNSEKNIDKCVQSIINQTYKNFEHIIIDNCSTDNTIQKIKQAYLFNKIMSNLRIISEKDYGISDAFNKGIYMASGDIIGILNSDDYYYSNNVFEKMISVFNDESILFAHGNILFVDKLYGSNIRKPLLCDLREAMPYNHPTMFIRKKLYQDVGQFDAGFKYAMDFDFVCKIKSRYNNMDSISVYIQGDPVTVMNAGGTSWANEIGSIKETKKILSNYKLWDNKAYINHYIRLFRTRMKAILSSLGLVFLVKKWRKNKWKTE